MNLKRLLLSAVLMLVAVTAAAQGFSSDVRPLNTHQPVEREIKEGVTHAYSVTLRRGEFLRVTVEQRAADLVLTLRDASGATLVGVDLLTGPGEERVSYEAPADGPYRLEVLAVWAPPSGGRYSITSAVRTATTALDRKRLAAERLLTQAEALLRAGGAEGLREAQAKSELAVQQWRELGEPFWLAYAYRQVGAIYRELGEPEKALDFYDEALRLIRNDGDRPREAALLSDLGFTHEQMGERHKAVGYFDLARQLFKAVGDRRAQAYALFNIGRLRGATGERGSALNFFNRALLPLKVKGYRADEADLLGDIALFYHDKGEPRRALGYRYRVLALRRADEDMAGEAEALFQIGFLHSRLNEREKAFDAYGKAKRLFAASGNQHREADTLNNLGVMYRDKGELQKALEHYRSALSVYEKQADPVSQAHTLLNVGNVYAAQGERPTALDYYLRALSLYQSAGDRTGEARALTAIAKSHYTSGDKPKSLDYLNQALSMVRAAGDRGGEADLLASAGWLYADLGQKQKALDFYYRALSMRRAAGQREAEAALHLRVGDLYLSLTERRKAAEHYRRALLIHRSLGERGAEADAFSDLGDVYKALGEHQKALHHYARALSLFKAAGDRRAQADTLENIGLVYDALGEWQTALAYYGRALPLYKAAAVPREEANLLVNTGHAHWGRGDLQRALSLYNQALHVYRAAGARAGEAQALHYIGMASERLGKRREALGYYEQALKLLKEIGDRTGEASLRADVARLYDERSDAPKAIENYEQLLPLYREAGDRQREADTLTGIADIYVSLDKPREALGHYEHSLNLRRGLGDRAGEAETLNRMGQAHGDMEEHQQARAYFQNALRLWRGLNDRRREAETLTHVCATHFALRERRETQECLTHLLTLRRAAGDRAGQAEALSLLGLNYFLSKDNKNAREHFLKAFALTKHANVTEATARLLIETGIMFSLLGDHQGALAYYRQVLSFAADTRNRGLMAVTLTRIGLIYSLMGDESGALKSLRRALSLYRATGDRNGEARVLNEIGNLYLTRQTNFSLSEAGVISPGTALNRIRADVQQAQGLFQQASSLFKAVRNRKEEAKALTNICIARHMLRDYQGALTQCETALSLLKEEPDFESAAVTYRLMRIWEDLSNPRMAVIYGKRAVNGLQSLRTQLNKLDREFEKSFSGLITDPYRELADILIGQGRLLEAEQVLGMLKEEEFFQFVRRDDRVAKDLMTRVTLTPAEREALERYNRIAGDITRLGDEYIRLDGQKKAMQPGQTGPIVARLEQIKKDLDDTHQTLSLFLKQLKKEFGEHDMRVVGPGPSLSAAVRSWKEPRTVVVSTIISKDRLNIILTTAGAPRAFIVDRIGGERFTRERLNALIYEFQAAAKNPTLDPRPAGQKLYDILVKPLEKDLQAVKADTIVWSLDGNLRYVPVAALYDERQGYLAERYASVLIALASRYGLEVTQTDQSSWRALGLGVSKPVAGFPALSNVPEELRAIVRVAGRQESSGLFEGHRLLDEDFSLAAFKLHLGHYQVIHAATHFKFILGTRQESLDSYLLLGSGEKLTLAQVNNDWTMFNGVELLVLSACETAAGGRGADGQEVEGFGALAQNAGARAVLATLWRVADASTRELMVKFYQSQRSAPRVTKVEALRRAQLALLNGEQPSGVASLRAEIEGIGQATAGLQFSTDPQKPYAHPYYWAPFILIGNWR